MNILFYLSRFPGYGGIETVTEIIGCRLIESGHQVSLLTHIRQDRDSELMSHIDYYLMPDQGKWDTVANENFAKSLLKEKHFDVIVVQDSYAPVERIVGVMKSSQVDGQKLLVFEHSTPLYQKKTLKQSYKASLPQEIYRRLYSWPKQLRRSRRRHQLMLSIADFYIVLAKGYVEELVSLCGKKWSASMRSKIRVINNPIRTLGGGNYPTKNNTILFVGQLNQNKRVDFMLDAWKAISKDYKNWDFQIVGDGPQLLQLKQRVEVENIARVSFVGYQNPVEYYKKSKLFWMASGYEGWPMTVVEAMQYGCVPIALNTFSSIKDIVDDGINGIIVKGDEMSDFVNATINLMQNDSTQLALSEGARNKTKQFDVNVIFEKWKQLLFTVVN